MKKKSIKTAIVIPLLVALVLGITAMAGTVGVLSTNTASRLTDATIETSVDLYSADFRALCQDAYGIVSSIAPLVADALNIDGTREITDPRGYVVNLLSDVLSVNDEFIGIWTCWEPNAFDGLDSQYAGTAYHDATGRFVPYITGGANGAGIAALTDYGDPVAGEYYQGALNSGKPYMTDPYYYTIDGADVLMSSIAIPILRGGAVRGVVGIDLNLNSFIETMNASSILGDGYLFVLSPGGLITTHPKPEFIMQPYRSIPWITQYEEQFTQILANGGVFEGKAFSDVLQTDVSFQCNGVAIGDTGRYWLICGVIPETTVTSASTELLSAIVLIGVALFIAVGLTAYVITGRSLAPLGPLTAFLRKAGETGDIRLNPADSENIRKFAQKQNELGLCIAGAAGFTEHVNKVSRLLETIAVGDLTADVRLLSEGDTMGLSLQKMLVNLNTMFGKIHQASEQVSTGAGQVADGAQALAQGATEQAASIEELSDSIAEISGRTKANAEMAGQAAGLADTIKDSAEKGSRQMEEMMTSVKEINEASHSIRNVIKTIDDIAFQTNILALNAAVEAARAGEHGKGFAVVAEEVRNLAAKSAEAAKDTESLIANSMEKAELGVRIADETSASLAEIVSGINESSRLVADIARSSEEQSGGIAQVNTGIDQVALVVQQNSATAEESAAAAEEMSGQSDMLQQLITQFKLKQ